MAASFAAARVSPYLSRYPQVAAEPRARSLST